MCGVEEVREEEADDLEEEADEDVDEEDPERAWRQIVDEDVRVGIDGRGVDGGFVVSGDGVGLSFDVGLHRGIREMGYKG